MLLGDYDVGLGHGLSVGIYPKFLLTDVLLGKLVKKIQELPTKDIFSIGEVGMDFEVAR